MSEYQLVASGSFTSDGSAKDIALRSDFDFFRAVNYTQSATTQTTGRGCIFEWYKGLADGYAVMVTKEDSSNAMDLEVVTSGGFTRRDQSVQTLGAVKAMSGTAIAKATSVVTVTSHGYSVGDRVRIYGTTGMLQVAGYDFTITAVPTANSFTLGYIDMSGFAADASAGSVRKVPNNPIYAPEKNYITGITAASSAVVKLSVTHGLTVGQKVRLHVSSDFGMVEMDNLIGEITAVSTANNTITLDIDSSGFTAFAFPTSATAAAGVTPAHIVPVGEIASVLDGAMDNTAQILMELGAGADGPAGSSSDKIYWQAYKAGFVNNE